MPAIVPAIPHFDAVSSVRAAAWACRPSVRTSHLRRARWSGRSRSVGAASRS